MVQNTFAGILRDSRKEGIVLTCGDKEIRESPNQKKGLAKKDKRFKGKERDWITPLEALSPSKDKKGLSFVRMRMREIEPKDV